MKFKEVIQRFSSVFYFAFQTVYDEWFITLYNLMYTALPVLGMSLFDQVRERQVIREIQDRVE